MSIDQQPVIDGRTLPIVVNNNFAKASPIRSTGPARRAIRHRRTARCAAAMRPAQPMLRKRGLL